MRVQWVAQAVSAGAHEVEVDVRHSVCRFLLATLIGTTLVGVSTTANASLIFRVDEVVHGVTGGFGHSLFHSARNITGGQRLAYFDLDPNAGPDTNFYVPQSGRLNFHGIMFSDQARTQQIGTFVANSSNLYGDDLSDNNWDNDLVGSITFDLSFTDTNSAFAQYMANELGASSTEISATLNYVDRRYGGVEPLFANSADLETGLLTLWGADGDVDSNGRFGPSILGSDIVLNMTQAPEPTSIALWLLAGGGCALLARRRRSA